MAAEQIPETHGTFAKKELHTAQSPERLTLPQTCWAAYTLAPTADQSMLCVSENKSYKSHCPFKTFNCMYVLLHNTYLIYIRITQASVGNLICSLHLIPHLDDQANYLMWTLASLSL